MLDVIYVLATLLLFAVVVLIVKGVERLGPPARTSAPREAQDGRERP